MNSILINRLSVVLAWAGVFVSSVIGISHVIGKSLPCGVNSGCDIVAQDPSSLWLGVPVAFYGLVGYVLLAVIGLWRGVRGLDAARPFVWIGFIACAFGFILSLILTAYAYFSIGATCPWCLASAGIMTLLLFTHVALAASDLDRPPVRQAELTLTACCVVLALGGVSMVVAAMKQSGRVSAEVAAKVRNLPLEDLVGDSRYLLGPADAPITIVEFADFYCPGCRSSYPRIKTIVQASRGKVRIGFRNYPLFKKQGHELSLKAAIATEYAMEKGKFWTLVQRLFEVDERDISTLEGLMAEVAGVGLDVKDLEKRMAAGDEALLSAIYSDKARGDKLGMSQTPTFFIFAKGLPTRMATSSDLEEVLGLPGYVKLIRGEAQGAAPKREVQLAGKRGSVLVAMSGGVDSSVVAAILKRRGYDVVGVTMQIWQESQRDPRHAGCCSLGAVEDARRVARILGIPHYVINYKDAFRDTVIQNFIDEYAAGRTPNPCVQCNKKVKFEALMATVDELGCDRLATGHYARIRRDNRTGLHHLLRARGSEKDQSYVLYMLGQKQLARTMFPLGELCSKDVTRQMATDLGLPVAQKPDSQEICFVNEAGGYAAFLRKEVPGMFERGEVVDSAGERLGEHGGVAGFTVGQRRGIGLTARDGRPLYVLHLSPAENRVVVGHDEELLRRDVVLRDLVWAGGEQGSTRQKVLAKIRYNMPLQRAILEGGDHPRLTFDQPVRAVTPGQVAVAYRGQRVVVGGVIV